MVKTLVVKELRETLGIVALGLLGAIYAFSDLAGMALFPWQYSRFELYPFVDDSLMFYLVCIAGGIGIALGLKQTAWEDGFGTYYFLLHLPTSRWRIFGVKLFVGLAQFLLVTGGFLLTYAVWAATPETHSTPFFWSMTEPAWKLWFAMSLVYVGAFLSGIRPGRWFGSRLVPLVAAGAWAFLAFTMPWWWLSATITMVGLIVGAAAIRYQLGSRDF